MVSKHTRVSGPRASVGAWTVGPNRDLNVGKIIALAPDLPSF